jgi:hypothetical protein
MCIHLQKVLEREEEGWKGRTRYTERKREIKKRERLLRGGMTQKIDIEW